MSESTASALISVLGGLTVAVIGVLAVLLPLLISTRKNAKQAAEQTTNDHPKNMRVEFDERHRQNADAIAEVITLVKASDRRNGARIARTNRRIDSLVDRMEIVEDTIPHPRRRTQ